MHCLCLKRKVKAKFDKCLRHVRFNMANWPEKATDALKRQNHVKVVVTSLSAQPSSVVIRWREARQMRHCPRVSAPAVLSPGLARWRKLCQLTRWVARWKRVGACKISTEGTPGSENFYQDRQQFLQMGENLTWPIW